MLPSRRFQSGIKDEATVQMVMADIKNSVHFKSNPLALSRFNGVDYEQTRDYIKMHTSMFIGNYLEGHGWETRTQRDHNHRESIYPSRLMEIETTKGPTF